MPSPIPTHAARKQAEICLVLLRDLEAAVAQGHPLDQHLAHIYRQHREFGSRDRRFFSSLAFAWFRWRGWLNTPSQPNALDGVLAWFLDASDMHPAIECLAHQLPPFPVPLQALGTAPINEKASISGQWFQQSPPDINALVPSWLPQVMFYPAGVSRDAHLVRCINAFQSRPPTWLRIQTGREQNALDLLNQHHVPATLHRRVPNAACLPDGVNAEALKSMPEIEIQDLASQCVGLVCAPAAGESWWDACSGSGGKGFHLADLMQGTGSILATDTRPNILKECQRRLARNRISSIAIRTWDGTAAAAPDRLFDGVLVDAPCSGIGTWHRNPDARWRTAPDVVSYHAVLQSNLLKTCADKVRPGGRLVYAVCTLTDAETIGVIHGFLAERSDFRLEPAPHPLTGDPTTGLIWIWPWEGDCNGMFIAPMRKG